MDRAIRITYPPSPTQGSCPIARPSSGKSRPSCPDQQGLVNPHQVMISECRTSRQGWPWGHLAETPCIGRRQGRLQGISGSSGRLFYHLDTAGSSSQHRWGATCGYSAWSAETTAPTRVCLQVSNVRSGRCCLVVLRQQLLLNAFTCRNLIWRHLGVAISAHSTSSMPLQWRTSWGLKT